MLKVVESFQLIGPTSPQAPNFSLPATFPNREFFQKEVVTCVTCVKYVTCVTCVTCVKYVTCDIRDMCDTCHNITCVTCVKYVTCVKCVTCVTCDMCDIRDMCDTCDNITCVHYHILCVTA